MKHSEAILAQAVQEAQRIRQHSHSPYSKCSVGCAIVTASGKIVVGTNVENASFGATICAERSAVFTAVGIGEKNFDLFIIASDKGWSPCGMCLQVMAEFCKDVEVWLVDKNQSIAKHQLQELMPSGFSPEQFFG